MLERPGFDAAGDHEPGVGVMGHGVGGLGVVEGLEDLCFGELEVEVDRLGGLEEPVDVFIGKGPAVVVEPQPLPHPVAEHEAGVIDADHCLGLGHDLAVDVDEDGVVARVLFGLMGGDVVLHRGLPGFWRRLCGGRNCSKT